MSLLINFISLLDLWRPVFCKKQLFERVRALGIGFLGLFARHTISNVSIFLGHSQKGYEADCASFSRRKWDQTKLFDPLLKEAVSMVKGKYICVAVDDTVLRKTGKKIKNAFWKRDPLSPPFHVNFMWGLRFLQFSMIVKSHQSSRAIPIEFAQVPLIKKLKKKASKEDQAAYKQAKKENNLSTSFTKVTKELKKRILSVCNDHRKLLIVGDAHFCNKTCMNLDVEGVEKLVRCRKNTKLCFRYEGPSKRKVYAEEKFTPEEVRVNPDIPWSYAKMVVKGKRRSIRYKELNSVLWQGGTKRKILRLIVIAPIPYEKKKNARLCWTQPAYLLSTVTESSAKFLIKAYISRWQIEVNHREEKSILGVGEAQVWNDHSIERQPAFHIATYSALLLAAQKTYQDKPQIDNQEPAWRKKPKRLTFRAMLGLLRSEIIEHPEVLLELNIKPVEIACLLRKAA